MILEQYREETFNTRYDGEVTLALYREKVTIGNMVVTKYRCFNITDYPNGSERAQLKFEAFDKDEADKLFEALKEHIKGYSYKEIYVVRVLTAPKGLEHIARTRAFGNLKEAEAFLEELNDNNIGASLEPISYYKSKE
jgi:hypothetical protein